MNLKSLVQFALLILFLKFAMAEEVKPLTIKFVSVEKSIIQVTKGNSKNSLTVSIENSTIYPKTFSIKFFNTTSKDVVAEKDFIVDPQSTKKEIVELIDGKELENRYSWSYSERVGDSKSTFLEITNNENFYKSARIDIFNKDDEKVVGQTFIQVKPKSSDVIKVGASNDSIYGPFLRFKTQSNYGVFKPINFSKKIAFPFFDNTKIFVCQSFDGILTTHSEDPMAFDFCAKEGESIRAVSDGIVYAVIDSFSESGHKAELLNKANLIGIMDQSGVIYLYAHIVKDSARVKIGDEVKVGQVIATVGSVGYSSAPHLHLSVARLDENLKHKSMFVEFLNSRNQVINLKYKSTIIDGKVK